VLPEFCSQSASKQKQIKNTNMMQLSTPLTLLAMTWMSTTDARIGDGHRDLSSPAATLAPTPADITEDGCAALAAKSTGYSWCKLTSTCLAPGDDTCKIADCEQNSGSTGYSWCVFTRSCIAPSATCQAQTCESNSDCPPTTTCVNMYGGPSRCGVNDPSTPQPTSSPTLAPTPADITEDECAVLSEKATGYSWCKSTGTCLAPGDDTCKEADCEQNSGSTGYSWCKSTRTCLAPGDDACKKADCEQTSGSTGYSWCVFSRSCIAPSATCQAQTCDSNTDCPPTTTCLNMLGGPSRCGQ